MQIIITFLLTSSNRIRYIFSVDYFFTDIFYSLALNFYSYFIYHTLCTQLKSLEYYQSPDLECIDFSNLLEKHYSKILRLEKVRFYIQRYRNRYLLKLWKKLTINEDKSNTLHLIHPYQHPYPPSYQLLYNNYNFLSQTAFHNTIYSCPNISFENSNFTTPFIPKDKLI